MSRMRGKCTISILMMLLPLLSAGQQKETYNVALFLWDGVELLDFAGPGEVFAAGGFNIYTVTIDGNEILSQGFVTVKPQYSLANAPIPDVVVFPGGGATKTSEDKKVLDWVKTRSSQGTIMLSVCTGAFILANSGLLEGKNITTHYGAIDRLRALHPEITILENTRLIDNGNIITTAGVSAGIDGALHLMSRIKGLDAAQQVARYMEYDKWNPAEARVDVKNEFMETLANILPSKDKTDHATLPLPDSKNVPFEGEFINLAASLKVDGKLKEAASVLEITLKYYPRSATVYFQLGTLYRQIGKAAPTEETVFIEKLKAGKHEDALTLLKNEQKAFPGWIIVSEDALSSLGFYYMYQKSDYKSAIEAFQTYAKVYPLSHYPFLYLGQAYARIGLIDQAAENYRKSLGLNPGNETAKAALAKLDENNDTPAK